MDGWRKNWQQTTPAKVQTYWELGTSEITATTSHHPQGSRKKSLTIFIPNYNRYRRFFVLLYVHTNLSPEGTSIGLSVQRPLVFVCLFVGFFRPTWRILHSYGDVTFTGEGLQILTYARHSGPLGSEGSLACHTYCDTGHPFKMVISEDPWHSHLLSSVWQLSCFYD